MTAASVHVSLPLYYSFPLSELLSLPLQLSVFRLMSVIMCLHLVSRASVCLCQCPCHSVCLCLCFCLSLSMTAWLSISLSDPPVILSRPLSLWLSCLLFVSLLPLSHFSCFCLIHHLSVYVSVYICHSAYLSVTFSAYKPLPHCVSPPAVCLLIVCLLQPSLCRQNPHVASVAAPRCPLSSSSLPASLSLGRSPQALRQVALNLTHVSCVLCIVYCQVAMTQVSYVLCIFK